MNCKEQSLPPIKGAFLVALMALTLSCSNSRYFQREVETVQHRLQGQGNVVVQPAEPERHGNSLRTSWEFQSEQPPTGLLDWSVSQLAQDYHRTSRTAQLQTSPKKIQVMPGTETQSEPVGFRFSCRVCPQAMLEVAVRKGRCGCVVFTLGQLFEHRRKGGRSLTGLLLIEDATHSRPCLSRTHLA